MIRRILAIILIVLGVGAIGSGIASATIWKPDSIVTVPLPAAPDAAYVVSDPGVLSIVNDTVQIRAVASDEESPVFLAMGRTDEVEAWVAPSDHVQITGLATWESLTVADVDGIPPETDEDAEGGAEAEKDPGAEDGEGAEGEDAGGEDANPAESDMWVEQVTGVGELSYTWEAIPGRWSMIVATDGSSPAPMVELTWEREVPTPALVPGIVIGSVLTLAGLGLLVADVVSRRRAQLAPEPDPLEADDVEAADLPSTVSIMAEVEAAAEQASPEDFVPLETLAPEEETSELYPHVITAEEPDRPLTRREIRERERAAERAAALGLADPDAPPAPAPWPTQEVTRVPDAGDETAPGEREPVKESAPARRRWWRRKPPPPPTPDPLVIDDDTGEIVVTGDIDLSSLNPQASGASWRATWGLSAPTQWIPVRPGGEEDRGEDEGRGEESEER